MIPQRWFREAEIRLQPHVITTPLTHDIDNNIYLKWESHQITGSFKVRGALNKVLTLLDWEKSAGLVTASAGNHGQGVALAGQLVNAPVNVFVPADTPKTKIKDIINFEAKIHKIAGSYSQAEKAGQEFANQHGSVWISPYNDPQVIAGQGTLAIETINQLITQMKITPSKSTWVVPIGGGGVIAGIGSVLKTQFPDSRLIGVQSEASAFMHDLFYKGSQDATLEQPSIAEGLSGPVESGSITIPIIKQYVDDILLVSEGNIRESISFAHYHYQEVIEGSAAVPLAAIITEKIKDRPIVLIITGRNIDKDIHMEILRCCKNT